MRHAAFVKPGLVEWREARLGAPSSETVDSLRLLKAFVKLSTRQRFKVIELVERLATAPAGASDHPLS